VVLPLFALANAGVTFDATAANVLAHPVSLGVMAGLIFGKQVGVTLASWLAVRMRLAVLPLSVSWRHIYGAGWLAGIGFTMSLFIAELALGGTPQLTHAKVGILGASLISGVIGWWFLRHGAPPQKPFEP